MPNFAMLRNQMIEHQLKSRGLTDEAVLNALSVVPREEFVATELVELAYQDTPLPIQASQTISQPYIVALMTAALELKPLDRVLEIGTGSGYAAAVLAVIAKEVYSIERHKSLADSARKRLKALGYYNTHVLCADGTLGWPDAAPFDAIVVAAGGPDVPAVLKQQLTIGGRLVIPVGASLNQQKLLRIRRLSEHEYKQEELGSVRFVPLIGAAGWEEETTDDTDTTDEKDDETDEINLPALIFKSSEHFADIEKVNLNSLLNRIGDSRLVLLGEASHGSAEFYDMRARISKELIEKKGFTVIAVEADWPDAAHINHYIRACSSETSLDKKSFTRFPTWMWANHSVLAFTRWLKEHNAKQTTNPQKVGFYGLDLYSLSSSIEAVLEYLDSVDPKTAELARARYSCLTPWAKDPALYARFTMTANYSNCESEVLATLKDLLKKRLDYEFANGDKFFNAEQNARLVANAERYYRTMYFAENSSWNQRDQHMFDTLQSILEYRGPKSKVIIWAHNSHIGDARATEMSAQSEFNIGQLVREHYGNGSYLIGFGTDHGTVAAASQWGGPMEVKQVQASHIDSYEHIFHQVKSDNFLLPLRQPLHKSIYQKLLAQRLERAIGVIYRPESELQSHYFYASLARQFDEYIWFDETRAVEAIIRDQIAGASDTFPFGL